MTHFATLVELSEGYASGALKPSDVTRDHLDRIAALDGKIGAYQAVYAEEAMRMAEAADKLYEAGFPLGPFHGIPFVLKDICDVKGRITTAGCKVKADRVSPTTGTVAKRLLAAGGVLLGKTKTVEHALGGWGTNTQMGTPWNPWDMAVHRVPGGSSSGTGVTASASSRRPQFVRSVISSRFSCETSSPRSRVSQPPPSALYMATRFAATRPRAWASRSCCSSRKRWLSSTRM